MPRRTSRWGLVGLLAAYVLLAPPVFFFAALALLLAVGRPRSGREWFWLAVSMALTGAWTLGGTANLAAGVTTAVGAMAAGIFVALVLGTDWALFRRVVVAATASLLAAVLWLARAGHRWAEVQDSFARGLMALFAQQADSFAARGLDPGLVSQVRAMGESSARVAPLLAGLLVVGVMAGLALAERWRWQITGRALGQVDRGFRALRFSDQVVWLLVVALAMLLTGPRQAELSGVPIRNWAANLLLVVTVCYVLRGLAVYQAAAARVARRANVVLAIVALPFWPIAATGLGLLGLADAWIDFRRRFGAPQPEDGPDDRSHSA